MMIHSESSEIKNILYGCGGLISQQSAELFDQRAPIAWIVFSLFISP